ncbi:hypothetical protein [Actinopolymorpha pittospori]
MIDDQPYKDDDEEKAREALAAGKVDVAIAHSLLRQAEVLNGLRWAVTRVWHQINTATRTLAEQDTRGVVFVRRGPTAGRWQGVWQCVSSKKGTDVPTREDALRWAAELPAGLRLFQNPQTDEWETWSAEAVLAGYYETEGEFQPLTPKGRTVRGAH